MTCGMWLALTLLLSCSSGTPDPAETPRPIQTEDDAVDATVIYATGDVLVVHHEEARGDRVVPGAAVYKVPVPELTEGLKPGDTVAMRSRQAGNKLQVRQLVRKGEGELPAGADGRAHTLTGTVVNTEPGRITVDHDPIEGVMAGMVMSFLVPPDDAEKLKGGDQIAATMLGSPTGYVLVEIERTGEGAAPLRDDIEPLKTGDVFPRTEVTAEDGSTLVIGEGQPTRTAITFLYTSCPDPAFCPALATRLGALQGEIEGKGRIVAITIDPEIDKPHILERYGEGVGADFETWRFGHLEPEWLQRVALLSGMAVTIENGKIAHLLRMVITDTDGTVIERYDDNAWPLERVAQQLNTGEPRQPPGEHGSRYEKR